MRYRQHICVFQEKACKIKLSGRVSHGGAEFALGKST